MCDRPFRTVVYSPLKKLKLLLKRNTSRGDYLHVQGSNERDNRLTSVGVPQGSVLGPYLLIFLHDRATSYATGHLCR